MKRTFNNIRALSKMVKVSKKYIIMYILLSGLISLVGIFGPILSAGQLVSITGSLWRKTIIYSIFIFGLSLFRSVINLAITYCSEKFSKVIVRQLQFYIAQEVLNIKIEHIDKHSNGLFIQRISGDASSLASIFTYGVDSTTNVLIDIGVFIVIFSINIWLGIYLIVFIIIFFIFSKLRIKFMDKLDKKYRDQRENTSGFATELIRGVRDIKMLYAKKSFLNSIKESLDMLNNDGFKLRMLGSMFGVISNLIFSLYDLGLIFILVLFMKDGILTLATSLVIYNYRHKISSLIYFVSSLLDYFREFNLSFDRVNELLHGEEFSKERFGERQIDRVNGDFEFRNVEFSYGKNKVLDKVNFKVSANETVAFVGKSGAGKTTIFNLLCKMYDVDKGEILIDGININELDEKSIRGNITIISQNPYIFNKSIKDNLKLVKENLTDEEMIDACKIACLDDYIETLPDGYDTIVGEGGVTLSGGQRQRLAIARALVQKTEIILFDEATSALDNETQDKIQKAISNLKGEYTMLIIAHRLSTIVNCDRILYIEDGKVLASGTHIELLKNSKEYKNLYNSEIINLDIDNN